MRNVFHGKAKHTLKSLSEQSVKTAKFLKYVWFIFQNHAGMV